MGHKVHPNGFRLGVYRNWEAKWFAPDKEYKPLLLEDVRLRRMLLARLKNAGVARIETERSSSALTITLHTPVALEKGLRFAIREGGRTVGAGTVSEIVA